MAAILEFGTERFALDVRATPDEREKRSRIMLARALNLRTTVAFVGSGCSAPLGYPVWRTLVADVVDETARAGHTTPDVRDRLREIHKRLKNTKKFVPSRDLIFYLGLCQPLLGRGDDEPLHELIAKIIGNAAKAADRTLAHNPYEALKELPIRRYVTSNYDRELELMVKSKPDVDREPLSFTQIRKDHGDLAGFAVVAVPGMRDAVFHCHGDYQKPSSIVASESDYQQWYLVHDDAATTFRQSLDLLFSSNPVLFLGFGMDDDDLLRPLRVFNADNPERRGSRLLFALTEHKRDDPRENDWMDSVHDRYGVNFITYDRPASDDSRVRGAALCQEIRRLGDEWRTHSDYWAQKPAIRRVIVDVSAHGQDTRPKAPYQHYSVIMGDEDLAPAKTAEDIGKLFREIGKPSTRVIVVTGDGGSGKSWRVLNLLRRMRRSRGRFKDGIFFWSSYYADDWLTGLDRALSYFETEGGPVPREKRLKRFEDALRSGEHLVVFDGFERLLRATGDAKTGTPYSQSVRELLDIMARHAGRKTRSTVILTSRLMPDQLQKLIDDPHAKTKRVVKFGVRRLTTEDLKIGTAFDKLEDEDLARICSLCGGHSYALLLASRFLKTDQPGAEERFADFRREISRRAPDSRNSAIIRLAIEAVDQKTDKLASKLLQRMAVFMSPIDVPAQDVCFDAATEGETPSKTREAVVKALLDAKLLLPVTGGTGLSRGFVPRLLTVHPIVRSYVFYRWHGVDSEALPNFTLAGFTSGNATCHPGDKGGEQVMALFDLFCNRAVDSTNVDVQRSMARAAFSIMRSRMDSNTVPRWNRYDRYIQLGLRLRHLVKKISPATWDYYERQFAETQQSEKGVLYADELAWLYNDIGLALCSEGSMADAYSLWEHGFEIDRVTDSEEEGGQYMVQSHLHMSHLFLELGRLRRATQFLATTERANSFYNDIDFAGRILGYKGLLAHLAGNLDEAGKLYFDAVKALTSGGRRNLRAESMFHRHWTDLLMAKKDIGQAEEKVEIALSLAREGDFPDLEAYARKSRAHVWRLQNRPARESRAEYNAAMDTAQERGIKRLQADIHSELARLARDVGDWETARIRAMESLKLANELSLGLRRTHGLIILGLAMQAAGNKNLARSYLTHALALANVQGYHLRGREAEELLQRLQPEE